MFYIILFLIIFILLIFIYYLINNNTSIVDGKIININKKRKLDPDIHPYKKYKITITYSYFVNGKKYINTIVDDFGISKILYKYKKINSNKQIMRDEYTYYVEKNIIKVCYKNNNPQDSKIKNFILKEILFLLIFSITFGLIIGLISYLFLLIQ